MDAGETIPAVRVAPPLLEDYGWVARRMRADEIAQWLALTGATDYHPDHCARVLANVAGDAYSFLTRDGFPILVGGFIPQNPGVLRAWMAGTEQGWAEHGRALTRIARRFVRAALDRGAHRVEAYSLASRHATHRWYEALGMHDEGLLAGWFADGSDARVHAIFRKKEA